MFTSDHSSNVIDIPTRSRASHPPRRLTGEELKNLIVATLDDKKGEQIVEIPLQGKADFADYMIVASGTSQRHMASLAQNVLDAMRNAGIEPLSVEGMDSADWVLVDGGDVVTHIFHPQARAHYNLEKMWSVSIPEEETVPA